MQIFLQIPGQCSTATVYTDRFAVALASVPEPPSALLMLVGLGYLAFLKRYSSRQKRVT
ncbi:PEP-CTERM sorting domain-containing protein [Nitrosospira multiformis]|uniref:PEP-CTERM sorting domain-containing protein n=1 Tax=Nitrosospira multiformis TaxID=1231 RepID=UPI0011B00107